jgi:hypothetical protein
MPRIKDELLESVIYLYPTLAAARSGERAGGTGFLVEVQSEAHPAFAYLYAVTNSHVIREANSPVVRLNTQQGDMAILPLTADRWKHHDDGDDVAAVHLGGLPENELKYSAIPTTHFLTKDIIASYEIGPGDDVFMVGRLIGQDGKQRNLPSVRFGNISMMPWEPVLHERGILQESFVVESRSLGGYSGSPVFVYTGLDYHRPSIPKGVITLGVTGGPWLLGVDWGHHRKLEKVREKDGKTNTPEGYVVRSNSGMMYVVPAWKVQDLLNQEEFVMKRKESDKRITDMKEAESVAELDMESETNKQEETFEDILKRVSRKTSEPES